MDIIFLCFKGNVIKKKTQNENKNMFLYSLFPQILKVEGRNLQNHKYKECETSKI